MNFKLSDEDVAAIRALAAEGGLSTGQIAERYGVSRQHIHRLLRGEQRVDLSGPVLDGPSVVAAVERALGGGRAGGGRSGGDSARARGEA